MWKILPHLSQNSILGKKGGAPQIRQKFNQLGFVSNFQGNLRPIKYYDLWWNILPHLSQNSILGKIGGGEGHPKLGINSTNLDFAQTFRVTSGQ